MSLRQTLQDMLNHMLAREQANPVAPGSPAELNRSKRAALIAKKAAQHDEQQAARKAANDPALVQKASAYFNSLDDSHRAAWLRANPKMEAALVNAGLLKAAEINRLLGASLFQTEDGQQLDPFVEESVFVS